MKCSNCNKRTNQIIICTECGKVICNKCVAIASDKGIMACSKCAGEVAEKLFHGHYFEGNNQEKIIG